MPLLLQILTSAESEIEGLQGPPGRAQRSTDTGVCEKTLLLGEPLPCNTAAETALRPLIWCSAG